MDYEALRNAWRSSANAPDAAASAYLLNEAQNTLTHRRRHLRRMLAFAALMLTIPLALMGVDLLTGQVDAIDLAREWGLVPFALIPFAALILIARRAAPSAASTNTLIEAFRALRADNAAARLRIRIIGGAMIVFAPLLFVLLGQLVAVGKMAPHEMQSAGVVLGGALALGALWMAIKFLTQLAPERRHLDALIAQYESAA
ncbi:MAG TPA: hypothetical protein VEA80_09305 [Vitreimonas sp.]|uniref:hypothetical protein n=1 Tax=Vitreimonas sp. TaxID=3069702 RepID=UPI002D5CD8A5|nr:hypothetical protein [Vitreimonas sp.]HYD87659.1 hypothetical protein [Vitreimonas sp.]